MNGMIEYCMKWVKNGSSNMVWWSMSGVSNGMIWITTMKWSEKVTCSFWSVLFNCRKKSILKLWDGNEVDHGMKWMKYGWMKWNGVWNEMEYGWMEWDGS